MNVGEVFQPIMSDTSTSVASAERQLVQDLLSNYDVNARPVGNASSAVAMQVGVALQQIVDLVRCHPLLLPRGHFPKAFPCRWEKCPRERQ